MKLREIKGLVPEKKHVMQELIVHHNILSEREIARMANNELLDLLGESEVGVDVEMIYKVVKDKIDLLENDVFTNKYFTNDKQIKSEVIAQALSASIEKWLVKK
jgi:hypothetical protein